MPERVQLSRAKGWRMPPNTVKVTRPGKWGNPVVVGKPHPYCTAEEIAEGHECARPMTAQDAVDIFRCFHFTEEELAALRGKNLACWCKLGQPCHADVLLEWANAPATAPVLPRNALPQDSQKNPQTPVSERGG